MTNRYDWQLGASTCIFGKWEAHNEENFSMYKHAGIRCAELSITSYAGLKQIDFINHPEKVASIAAGNDVELTSFHVPFSDDISFSNPDADIRHHAEEIIKTCILSAKNIGIKTMVLHPSRGYYEQYSNRETLLKQCMNHVGEIYEFCETLGVNLAVENMTANGVCCVPEEMMRFLHAFPNLSMCFDTNHPTQITAEMYLDALIREGLQGRIGAIHVSDYDYEKEQHLLPGKGKINWASIMEKLELLEFNGVFMYEISSKYTPLQVRGNYESLIMNGL